MSRPTIRCARPRPTATSAPAAGSAWRSNVVELAALVAIVAVTGSIGGRWAVALLVVGTFVLGLPFGVAGYRLSRAYGLSRQTPAGWLADRAKGAGVGLVLGAVAPAGLLGIQRAARDWWPLPAWLAIVAFSALLAALWPVLLLPLFLRSEPMAGGRARRRAVGPPGARHVHVRELRLLQDGREDGGRKRDGGRPGADREDLRLRHAGRAEEDEDEGGALARTRVVLAHELGHHVHHDMWRLLADSAATLAVGVAGAWAAIEAFAPHGGRAPLDAAGRRARVLARHRRPSRRSRPPTRAGASGPPTPTPRRSRARGRRSRGRWSGSSRAT